MTDRSRGSPDLQGVVNIDHTTAAELAHFLDQLHGRAPAHLTVGWQTVVNAG